MRVFVCVYNSWDDHEVIQVVSTEKEAQAWVEASGKSSHYYEEFELDAGKISNNR